MSVLAQAHCTIPKIHQCTVKGTIVTERHVVKTFSTPRSRERGYYNKSPELGSSFNARASHGSLEHRLKVSRRVEMHVCAPYDSAAKEIANPARRRTFAPQEKQTTAKWQVHTAVVSSIAALWEHFQSQRTSFSCCASRCRSERSVPETRRHNQNPFCQKPPTFLAGNKSAAADTVCLQFPVHLTCQLFKKLAHERVALFRYPTRCLGMKTRV